MARLANTVIGEGNSERVELLQNSYGRAYSVEIASKGFITSRSYPDYTEALDVYLEAVQHMVHAETARQ